MANARRSARENLAITIFAIVLLSGCTSKHPDKSAVAAKSPMASSIHFTYAVYLPSDQKDVVSKAQRVISQKYPDFKLVEKVPEDPKSMFVQVRLTDSVQTDYQPPSLKALTYSGEGLTPSQKQTLQNVKSALILEFTHPKEHVWTALKRATILVGELGRTTNGFIWDEETRQVFTASSWQEKRIASWTGDVPAVSNQIVIHSYKDGEYVRAITLGMSKMGLPDVVVQEFPWSSDKEVVSLIDGFSQILAEGQSIPAAGQFKFDVRNIRDSSIREEELKSLDPNGTGKACLTLKSGKWEEGDPKNQLIELGPDAYPGAETNTQQDYMLSLFFGSKDTLKHINHTDELLAASAKAKERLPELRRAFKAGLEPGEYVLVKAPFKTGDGNEWMWVEVTAWNDKDIKGTLENDPAEALYLHSGQVVHVKEDEVFDYLRHYADNHDEGNTTGAIIKKMQRPEEERDSTEKKELPACE